MSGRVALRAFRLRAGAEELPEHRSGAARGETRLLVVKGAVLLACGLAAWWPALVPLRLDRPVGSSSAEFELRCPQDWRAWWCDSGMSILEPPAPGNRAFLLRLSWEDFEGFYRLAVKRSLEPGWREQESSVLAAVAEVFHMRMPCAEADSMTLGGKPARVMVSQDRDGWTAVAVAPGEDLALFGLQSRTDADLRRAWPLWTAMTRTIRLYDPLSAP